MYNPHGAWGPPGSSNYSYPGYGGPGAGYPIYGAPGSFQTLTPGPQYAPGTNAPGAGSPTPTYDYNSSAPPAGGGSSVPVPTPVDPGGGGNPYFGPTTENFVPPTTGAIPGPFGAAIPPRAGSAAPQLAAGDAAGPRFTPVALEQSRAASLPGGDSAGAGERQALTGTVQFDPLARVWELACPPDPARPELPTRVTLAAGPLTQTLRNGERVRLEGELAADQTDRAGQPLFVPQRIIRGDLSSGG